MVSERKRKAHIQKLISWFAKPDKWGVIRKGLLQEMKSPEQFEELVRYMRANEGELAHLQKWINTHRSASSEMKAEDFKEVLDYFAIDEVQDC